MENKIKEQKNIDRININKLKSWLLNDPLGVGQQKFWKQLVSMVNRERNVIEDEVKKELRKIKVEIKEEGKWVEVCGGRSASAC